jgi:hypothetical protein
MPIALFAGIEDQLATIADTDWLSSQLGNVVHYEKVPNVDHGFDLAKDMSYFKKVMALTK